MIAITEGMVVHAHCEKIGQSRMFTVKEVKENGRLVLEADNCGQKVVMECRLYDEPGIHLDVTDRNYL